MPSKRRRHAGVVELPKGVHRVVSRGREYFYWQPGRGTKHEAPRIPLPRDPQDPGFWVALRQAQKLGGAEPVKTVGDVIDLYETSTHFHTKLGKGTQDLYRRNLRVLRAGFGTKPAATMRPSLIREVMEGLADKPAAANNFLTTMRAFSTWSVVREHFPASISEGVAPYAKDGGHKPWTDAQIAAIGQLAGMVRRGVMLALYTGQRGSDVVRLGPTDIDEGGFRIQQVKTKREVWCPVVPELAAEIATWERRPGPFLLQADGRPYTRKRFSIHFDAQRAEIPVLAGASLHGLRSTAVVRLRRAGLSTAQIQDIVGMSMAMIERYSRFADRKASGQAAVVKLTEKSRRAGSDT